jgi:hypothetical protein
MEIYLFEKKCFNHQEKDSYFYCFDDQMFLCDSCFKHHRKHNIEVKSEIKKYAEIYTNLNKNKSINENLERMKAKLNEIKIEIENNLKKINSILSILNKSAISATNNSILNLNYQEYESIGEYTKLVNSMKDISKKLNDFININVNNKNTYYKNLREINKEVDIIEHSKEHNLFTLNVMLGKKQESFSLFEGASNHFAIFDLKKKFYVKDILISVKQKYKCVLKHFDVSVKNIEGEWELVNKYVCKNNTYEIDMQNFPIEREARYVKINFIDTWPHPDESDSILIKKLSFKVADII